MALKSLQILLFYILNKTRFRETTFLVVGMEMLSGSATQGKPVSAKFSTS